MHYCCLKVYAIHHVPWVWSVILVIYRQKQMFVVREMLYHLVQSRTQSPTYVSAELMNTMEAEDMLDSDINDEKEEPSHKSLVHQSVFSMMN